MRKDKSYSNKTLGWYVIFSVFLFSLVLQFSLSEATTLNVVGVNRNPAGTPAGTPAPAPTTVDAYYWTLQEDLTYPIVPGDSSTNWMAAGFHKSYMPVVASGCVTAEPNSQCPANTDLSTVTLDPAKRYFISVLPLEAGSYTNGGAPFKGIDPTVKVYVQKLPLPLAQISVYVSEDAYPINGFPDPVTERPLEGFRVFLIDAGGKYGISGGPDAYDAFGNNLGTTYALANGVPVDADGDGSPEPLVQGLGYVLTNANGMANLKYLPPGKLSILVLPPQGQEDMYSQTTTIEGTKVVDAWIKPGEPPYLMEFGPPMPHVFISFAKTDHKDTTYFTGAATITGQIVNDHMSPAPALTITPGLPFTHTTPWIGLNDTSTGKGIYVTRTNTDGTFSIPYIVPGVYQLVTWDDFCDIIINFATVTVADGATTVDMGKVPVINWFTGTQHQVFLDANENGFPDPGETGIPLQTINLRWRDGTVYQSNATGGDGWIGFNEVFPFFNWQIAEVDFLRYKATGVTVTVDQGGPTNPADPWSFGGQINPQIQADGKKYRTEVFPSLLEAFQGFTGQNIYFQWGKKPYGPNENGGITGIVHYSVTRDADDPAQDTGTPWEPGIAGVQVNLYQPEISFDASGNPVIATYQLSDVDNYPFQWTGKGDPTYPGYTGVKGSEDVDRNGNGIFEQGDALQVAWTDNWDENIPTECQGPKFTLFGTTTPADCFDGLLNWNQARPGVFDGGYAFGTATGAQPGDPEYLPFGIYVVEAVPPPGYEIVKEQDKNVDFGDNYLPQPSPGPVALGPEVGLPPLYVLPPLGVPQCVGDEHLVPAELSLFPGVESAYNNHWRRKCDRKLVVLENGANAAANFLFFTKAPIAAQATGLLLDDITNDPRPGSPNAGEKYAPPWIPVSIQDWTGREIARTYSDEWGRYNALFPSTYTANTPLPSGMTPQMLTTCLNAPMMPNPAYVAGGVEPEFIRDPWFNKYYGQFCYTWQYMPGSTTYLDTPVLPTSAYIGGTQFQIDCEREHAAPVISSVTGPGNVGPYVSAAGQTITITSMGGEVVSNPAYNPFSNPGVPKTITRDHGFGTREGTVKIGNVTIPAANVTWSPATITAAIPGGTSTGQLVVTRGDNQRSSINGVTVTVGGPAPKLVPSQYATIQSAIDAASSGDLILVAPGRYTELVIMWKPVKLQGSGVGSTTIDAVIAPVEKVHAWREKVVGLCQTGNFTLLPTQKGCDMDELINVMALGGAGQNVLLESPGIIVLGKDPANFALGNSRIDGFFITGSSTGGGVIVNGYAHGLEISNNRISNNMGVVAGGIRVGHTDLVNAAAIPAKYQSAYNDGLYIHNNMITNNSDMVNGAGGLMLGTGSDDYTVSNNWICGNISLSAGGGGIGHQGLSDGGLIQYNTIIFNEAWSNQAEGEGGGIFVRGLPPAVVAGATPALLSEGSGSVTINANLIVGNGTGAGDGAGIAAAQVNGLDVQAAPGNPANWHTLDIFNNMIANNVAGLAGGGIALQDVARGRIIHNTVANNDSTATARAAFGAALDQTVPQPAGIVSRAHSAELAASSGQTYSNPQLINNIIWHNRSFYAAQNAELTWSLVPAPGAYNDLGVLGASPTDRLSPTFSVLTDTAGYASSNRTGDPRFLREYFNYGPEGAGFQVPGVADEGGNFLRVVFGPLSLMRSNATGTAATGQPYGNYHIGGLSPALNRGTRTVPGTTTLLWTMYPDLSKDFDRGDRPSPFNLFRPDIGADERPPGAAVGQILP